MNITFPVSFVSDIASTTTSFIGTLSSVTTLIIGTLLAFLVIEFIIGSLRKEEKPRE